MPGGGPDPAAVWKFKVTETRDNFNVSAMLSRKSQHVVGVTIRTTDQLQNAPANKVLRDPAGALMSPPIDGGRRGAQSAFLSFYQ
jgi:hypothetical protein